VCEPRTSEQYSVNAQCVEPPGIRTEPFIEQKFDGGLELAGVRQKLGEHRIEFTMSWNGSIPARRAAWPNV
jgi:hypothetical protein